MTRTNESDENTIGFKLSADCRDNGGERVEFICVFERTTKRSNASMCVRVELTHDYQYIEHYRPVNFVSKPKNTESLKKRSKRSQLCKKGKSQTLRE